MTEPRTLDALRHDLALAVRESARRAFGVEPERVVLERPPKVSLGDLATPVAFDLARSLRRAPRAIASELAAALSLPDGVREARVEAGGYVNVFLDRTRFVSGMLTARAPEPARGGKIVVEHTNINPNKAAHIGHLRNAVLGDVLVRTLRFLGHEVEVQNYIDDTGVQVADVVAGFLHVQNVSTAAAMQTVIREAALPSGVRNARGFACLCWDVYAE
ncbi:MAG: arginine--tRNA ligase, partial [Thermoanaerobaculia bacterium]